MRDSQPRPLLAKWPFYISNILLVLLAVFLAFQAKDNLSAGHIFWCIFSVLMGAILFIYPFYQEFKAHVSLQKARNMGLNKEQIQRLDQTLYQMQELKEGILQHNHKQALDQNLIASTLQSVEERFNVCVETLAATQASGDHSNRLERLELKLEDVLESLHAQQALLGPKSVEIAKKTALPTADELESHSTAGDPVPAFFRSTVVPSSENKSSPALNTLDETLHTLYPDLGDSRLQEQNRRNLFAEDKSQASAGLDSTFSFDLENLVTQNILSHQDEELDLSPEEAHTYGQVQTVEDINLASQASSYMDAETTPDQPTFSHFVEDPNDTATNYNPAQGTSLVVHANLGIGKKPYIRGQGPGLNWIYGAPMSFMELGKWQWTAPDSSQPIICRIYKNDEVPADGEVLCLQPGEQIELSPVFKQ